LCGHAQRPLVRGERNGLFACGREGDGLPGGALEGEEDLVVGVVADVVVDQGNGGDTALGGEDALFAIALNEGVAGAKIGYGFEAGQDEHAAVCIGKTCEVVLTDEEVFGG